MQRDAVSWRFVLATLAVLGLVGGAVVLVSRARGFDAVEATVPGSTRWFVDRPTGRVVLVDGYGGRALARLQPGGDTLPDDVAQDGAQAALVDRSARATRAIDGVTLKLGASRSLPAIGDPATIIAMASTGLVAVDPTTSEGFVVPPGGTPVRIGIAAEGNPDRTRIAPDGAVWTLADQALRRTTDSETATVLSGLGDVEFTLVGNTPFVVDRDGGRARFGDGGWVSLPGGLQFADMVIQAPSPTARCGWVAVDTELFCIDADRIVENLAVEGLDVDGGDLFAVAGDAAAIVDRTTGQISRINWRDGTLAEAVQADVSDVSSLRVATAVDLVWVDAVAGGTVWAVSPWGITAVKKDDDTTPLLGEEGAVISDGRSGGPAAGVDADGQTGSERKPDDDGNDDPPVAVDDAVSARADTAIPISVTANDYDPDGEAIVLAAVTAPRNGTATVASATTVSYQPSPDFVGTDSFEYTIVDGDGTEATATVSVEMISADTPNKAPIAVADRVQTSAGKPVIADVLLNDVDPERDAIRIDRFNGSTSAGTVEEVTAPSGFQGLRFTPAPEFSGEAKISYAPMDALGAVGSSVDLVVDVASPGTENRPPTAKPDAIRVRRGVPSALAVLANDADPDGDQLSFELIEPLPDSIDATAQGDRVQITARAGAKSLSSLRYRVTDPAGAEAFGSVLVAVVTEDEPNRAPIANPDTATAVAGTVVTVDVLRNDSDPDGDALSVVSATASAVGGKVTVDGNRLLYNAPAASGSDSILDRFSYRISDGNGHESTGVVSVNVIPKSVPSPPTALDDAATTEQDVPVVVNVLINDSDPSGGSLSIVGTPGCPNGGTASVTAEQYVRFNPPSGRTGNFACSYEVANAAGLRTVGSVRIKVVPRPATNRPPIIVSEERTVRVGGSVTVAVLQNDTDPDGPTSALKLVRTSVPVSGTATRNPDNTITYNAPESPVVVAISYDVADQGGAIASGRLVVRVIGEPKKPPIAVPDARTVVSPAAEVVVDALANDVDPDGSNDTLKLSGVEVLSGSGTAAAEGRVVRVRPAAGYIGPIQVRYQITDPDDQTAAGLITVTVTEPENRPPVATPDSATVAAGAAVTVPIALNDSDPDGDDLTFSLVTGPQASVGTAKIVDGQLVFDSSAKANGPVKMRYRVSDGKASAEADVTVTVIGCASASPVAKDAFLETGYRQPIRIDLNDYAANGQVVDVSGVIQQPVAEYVPPEGENGNVVVNFAVQNACGDRAVGTVTIDVNQDPVGGRFVRDVPRDKNTIFPVDDLASDDEPLRIASLSGQPDWVQVTTDRRAITVNPGQASGRADFVVVVTDPGGLTAQVPAAITVANGAPLGVSDVFEATTTIFEFAPIANDSDPDGDTIAYQVLPDDLNFDGKTVPLQKVNERTLRADLTGIEGRTRFEYTVADKFGLASEPITVDVITKWSPPVANDATMSVTYGGPFKSPTLASDPDGQATTLRLISVPPSGLALSPDGDRFEVLVSSIVPLGRYNLQFSVTDTGGRSVFGTLTVNVIENAPGLTAPSTPGG